MIKAISAIAVAAFIAAALTVLPGFAPKVEASEPAASAKADRLPVKTAATVNCAGQAWPNIDAACLKGTGNGVVREARLVTAERR